MEIININKHRWRNTMKIDEIINNLKSNPAKNYSIEQTEDLAKQILKDCGFDNVSGATPIIKIANILGFLCLKAENIPEDISGNIFVGGTTKDI